MYLEFTLQGVGPKGLALVKFHVIKKREKYKISPCSILDLQFTPCGLKTNLEVPEVCQKKKKKSLQLNFIH